MLLEILIPTFNRENILIRNIEKLIDYILKLNIIDKVGIIVSDNNSEDDTYNNISNLIKNYPELSINIYCQQSNIGGENNVVFLLSKADSEYVMFLGDDDFINADYLKEIVKYLTDDTQIACILPAYIAINSDGNPQGYKRDCELRTKIYTPGFSNCLTNSWRGHQLSGIVLKRSETYEEYIKRKVQNIYPFIFFVAFNCIHGKTVHLTDYPIHVTVIPQNKKDWGYKDDGLVSEVFDNFKKLFTKQYFKRFLLEINFLSIQYWRYFNYLPNSYINDTDKIKPFFICVRKIIMGANTSLLTSLLFPFLVIYLLIKVKIFNPFVSIIKRNIKKLVKGFLK